MDQKSRIDDQILRLQLSKPKNWKWQLNTSRSSPHIPLPIIQLYDHKKNLLVETKPYDRRSWNCELNTNDKIRIKEHILLLKKSNSDAHILQRNNRKNRCEQSIETGNESQTRYTYRSSNAGTLVICENDNNNNNNTNYRRRRRRQKLPPINDKNSSSSDSDDYRNNKSSVTRHCTDVQTKRNRKKYEKRKSKSTSNIRTIDVKNAVPDRNDCGTIENPNEKLTGQFRNNQPAPRVNMGANFSRHSSKGLTGRRCQSISNICPSKDHYGREVDAAYKFCNSLPSPTNGAAAAMYNNNYEQQYKKAATSVNECRPLEWKFAETDHHQQQHQQQRHTMQYDQGYGSERSPDEEIPPPEPAPMENDFCYSSYPFITAENTFEVELVKSSRGLGLSVCGGIDTSNHSSYTPWPGLLRIKRLFPHQPAAVSGHLAIGDLLLEANGASLIGLSNYEALEVLRMTSNKVVLLVCRPPPEILSAMSPISDVPPPPPRRTPPHSQYFPSNDNDVDDDDDDEDDELTEFEIILNKINGSLGFTLCKEDEQQEIKGHYVRGLVREPAISDGRIKPGDQIIAVNGTDITSLSHEQAVQFLRQCGTEVLLRLRRMSCHLTSLMFTNSSSGGSAILNTHSSPNNSLRPKANLRQEAVDMLSDLAARKLSNNTSTQNATEIDVVDGVITDYNYDYDEDDDDDGTSLRPNFLDLYNPNQTPVAIRKTKFNLSLAHNAYELNNLDPEMLDAPNLSCSSGGAGDNLIIETTDEPVSMPLILSNDFNSEPFCHTKPVYQSAHPQTTNCKNDSSGMSNNVGSNTGTATKKNLTKWKGVVFSTAERDLIENDAQVLSIELNRGWNSRLGFSLQDVDGCTCVSAVYSDSVAARDGRLRIGDCLLTVNDEMVENMKTSDVIDLLRIIRGPVCMSILRRRAK